MLTKTNIDQFNKELAAGIKMLIAKFEQINRGAVIRSISTEREPSEDGQSYNYIIRVIAQAVKPVEDETAPK